MLTIKSPIELKCGKTLVPTQEAFYHKIVDNYGMITSGINREDLLHVVTAPPEVYLAEGGMTNLVNSQNIQNTQEMKVEVINNLINRIALTQDVDMTYQDRVYITTMLNKLGVRNVNEFMTQVSRLKQETQTTEQLISLYWNHLEELTEMVEEYHNISSQEGDQIENRWQQERKYLHQEIMNRLQTGAIYQILNNFYTNHNGADRYVTNQELQITEQKRTSVNILLNRLQNVVGDGKVPLAYRHENIYESQKFEETEVTSETVTSQITSAVLLNLVDNLYMNRVERQMNQQSMWVHLEDALYQTAENTLWRMRTEINNQYIRDGRQEITALERHEMHQREIQAIQYLLEERQSEQYWLQQLNELNEAELAQAGAFRDRADMQYPEMRKDDIELSDENLGQTREVVLEHREFVQKQVERYLESIQLRDFDSRHQEEEMVGRSEQEQQVREELTGALKAIRSGQTVLLSPEIQKVLEAAELQYPRTQEDDADVLDENPEETRDVVLEHREFVQKQVEHYLESIQRQDSGSRYQEEEPAGDSEREQQVREELTQALDAIRTGQTVLASPEIGRILETVDMQYPASSEDDTEELPVQTHELEIVHEAQVLLERQIQQYLDMAGGKKDRIGREAITGIAGHPSKREEAEMQVPFMGEDKEEMVDQPLLDHERELVYENQRLLEKRIQWYLAITEGKKDGIHREELAGIVGYSSERAAAEMQIPKMDQDKADVSEQESPDYERELIHESQELLERQVERYLEDADKKAADRIYGAESEIARQDRERKQADLYYPETVKESQEISEQQMVSSGREPLDMTFGQDRGRVLEHREFAEKQVERNLESILLRESAGRRQEEETAGISKQEQQVREELTNALDAIRTGQAVLVSPEIGKILKLVDMQYPAALKQDTEELQAQIHEHEIIRESQELLERQIERYLESVGGKADSIRRDDRFGTSGQSGKQIAAEIEYPALDVDEADAFEVPYPGRDREVVRESQELLERQVERYLEQAGKKAGDRKREAEQEITRQRRERRALDMQYPANAEEALEIPEQQMPERGREIVRENRELFERQIEQYLETVQLRETKDGRVEFVEHQRQERRDGSPERAEQIFREVQEDSGNMFQRTEPDERREEDVQAAHRFREPDDSQNLHALQMLREQYIEERIQYFEHIGQFVSYLTRQPSEQIQPMETIYQEREMIPERLDQMQTAVEAMQQTVQTADRRERPEISKTMDRWQETRREERPSEFPAMAPSEERVFYQKENQLLTEEYQNRFMQVQNQQETINQIEQKLVEEHLHHQDNRRDEVQQIFVNPEENLELLEQQLNQINQQNVENYNRYQEMLQQQAQQRKTGRTQPRSMREDSLMALTNPQGLLEEYRKEAESREVDPERQLREMTALLPEETRRIYEQVMRVSESAGQPDQMERMTRNNIGLLLHDIHQVQQETTQVQEHVNAQTEHIRETIETETTKWEERQAAKPNVQSQHTFSRRDISMVHKSMENQVNEEFLAQLLEQNRQMQNVTKVNEETVTQQQTIKTKTVNQTHNIVTQEHYDINELIQRGVQKQIGTISDQIYSKLERRLQNEKKRRGF